MKPFLIILFACFGLQCFGQKGTAVLTPVVNFYMQRTKIEVPAKFGKLVDTSQFYVNLPRGYKARVFYTGGMNKPRFMGFSPSGVLHVSDMGNGNIIALPDANNDGIADTAIIAASGFTNNHDVKFYNGNMYVSEPTRVTKLTDNNKDGIFETKTSFISGLPGGGNHITRTMIFDSVNHKLYLSIGSSCNVCRETTRAIIAQYNDDGTGKRTYAYGARNAVGMGLHPFTNRLWANNNGSDNHGNEIPPEWVDLVRDSGFYGHPLAYGDQAWFNFDFSDDYKALKPITRADSNNVSKMIQPAALIRAHSAPLGFQFLNSSFPSHLRNGLLMALHGSWNSPLNFRGYKIVYLDLSGPQDTTVNFVADFCTGFLTDTVLRKYWGRPTGLAVDNRGNIYMTSDETNTFVLQIYPADTVAAGIETKAIYQSLVYPNPFKNSFTVSFALSGSADIAIKVWDITGKLVKDLQMGNFAPGSHEVNIGSAELAEGIFFYELKAGNSIERGKILHVK